MSGTICRRRREGLLILRAACRTTNFEQRSVSLTCYREALPGDDDEWFIYSDERTLRNMKFRFILPGLYLLVLLLFGVFFLKGAGGHGWNPFDFFVYITMPACLLLDLLPRAWGPQTGFLSFLLCALAGLVQWVIIGYLVDKLLSKWKVRKRTDD